MISDGEGLLVPQDHDFVNAAVKCLLGWREHPSAFAEVSHRATLAVAARNANDSQNFQELLRALAFSGVSAKFAAGNSCSQSGLE